MSYTLPRAAYWTDGQSDVCLAQEEDMPLSDEALIERAKAVAIEIGLDVGHGDILIGEYKF